MNIRGVLGSVAGLRTMAIAVCTATNLFFVSIFVVSPNDQTGFSLGPLKFTLFTLMIALFVALRFAMKSLTSAKDEDLDELQLKLRDDAYRLGYLVVRRVGLGALIAISLVSGPVIRFYYDNVARAGLAPNNSSYFSIALKAWFEPANLMIFVQSLLFVLTFTAYCFPLVILAWRQANFLATLTADERLAAMAVSPRLDVKASNLQESAQVIAKHVLRFRLQLSVVAIGWPILLSAAAWGPYLSGGIWSNYIMPAGFAFAIPFMLFTLWVHFAGMFKQRVILNELKSLAVSDTSLQKTYRTVHRLAIATGVFSVALPVLSVASAAPSTNRYLFGGWVLALVCSLGTLAAQTSSFMVADRTAKRFATDAAKLIATGAEPAAS